jgi:YjbE family integral membrane protein
VTARAAQDSEAGLNLLSDLLTWLGTLFTQFGAEVSHPQFWVNLSKIIWINILLSGDNALVVAMACRSLEPRQRFWGMILGTAAAVLLRIIFTVIIASVMGLPYLKLVGGLALLVIAAKLLVPQEEEAHSVGDASHLWAAVQIVVVADIVMSLDNVIAVAAAADGSLPLLVLGLASSIPLIIAGAALIMALLGMLPILVWAGSALLGWIAGEVIATDPAVHPKLQMLFEGALGIELDALVTLLGVAPLFVAGNGGEIACAFLGAVVVLIAGAIWRRRSPHLVAQQRAN